MGYRNYSVANGFIVDKLGNGDFTTIQSAVTAATSGDTIFIRPGTYTENVTLKVGVNLVAFAPSLTYAADSGTLPDVIINGTCTLTGAGTVGIDGIGLQTNSAAALVVSGSAASVVILNDCFLNCSNNTGITFSSTSASSIIEMNYCGGDLGTTGIALFAHSSAGNLRFLHSSFSNSGTSLTANTISSTGGFFPNFSSWSNGMSLSSSSNMQGSYLDMTMSGNQVAVTTAGTSTVNLQHCNFTSGTSSCISIGATSSVTLHYSFLSSSNAATIAGTGTLDFTNLSFNSVAALAAGLTLSEGSMNIFLGAGGVGTTGQVLTSNGPSSPPTYQAAGTGVVVQQIRATKSAAQTITNNIAAITTTPTTSTGSSIVQVSITPTNASHILLIEGLVVATSAGNNVGAYIIQNAAGNSIATSWSYANVANEPLNMNIRAYITAGGTSAITFDLYGTSVSTNTFVNANTSATQLSGGTVISSLQVTEYTA
jgi:hypothetical protein